MLIPALISLAFRTPPGRRNFHVNVPPIKHPRLVAIELKELLPEISETITIAHLYFNALGEEKMDRVDDIVKSVVNNIGELQNLLTASKTRGVMLLCQKIRREIESIPRLLTYLMYHSKEVLTQREYAEIRNQYDIHVAKDSLLRDILSFLRWYCITRSKGSKDLIATTTSNVDSTLGKK